jgi:GrpB-like predicted nucleotidyltransferase (UPF0157 family)
VSAKPDPAEPVAIVAYDPRWPRLFATESEDVREALGGDVVGVEHVGSTAVPGLVAKPVIDMVVGLRTLPLSSQGIAAMEELGYEYLGELGIPGRLFFRKGRPRSHHVHAVLFGSDLWERHLAFRDYLRVHPGEAAAYGQFKRNLVAEVGGDRGLYTERKDAFAAPLEQRARAWRLAGAAA